MEEKDRSVMGDEFDAAMRKMDGRNDVVSTRAATVTVQSKLALTTQDWIIQTFRESERDDEGRVTRSWDVAFVRYMDHRGAHRFVLPAEVVDTIVRQRDALGAKNKKRAARETMRRRRAAGEDIGAALRDPKVRKAARAARKANAVKKAAKAKAVRS